MGAIVWFDYSNGSFSSLLFEYLGDYINSIIISAFLQFFGRMPLRLYLPAVEETI